MKTHFLVITAFALVVGAAPASTSGHAGNLKRQEFDHCTPCPHGLICVWEPFCDKVKRQEDSPVPIQNEWDGEKVKRGESGLTRKERRIPIFCPRNCPSIADSVPSKVKRDLALLCPPPPDCLSWWDPTADIPGAPRAKRAANASRETGAAGPTTGDDAPCESWCDDLPKGDVCVAACRNWLTSATDKSTRQADDTVTINRSAIPTGKFVICQPFCQPVPGSPGLVTCPAWCHDISAGDSATDKI